MSEDELYVHIHSLCHLLLSVRRAKEGKEALEEVNVKCVKYFSKC